MTAPRRPEDPTPPNPPAPHSSPTPPSLSLEVSVDICAEPDTVWRFLSEGDKFVQWLGAMPGAPVPPGSRVEPRAGGEVCIMFPNNARALGRVVSLEAKRRVVFTWGYEPDSAGTGLGPGSCTIEVLLMATAEGTRVTLRHTGPMREEIRRQHIPGWQHYLAMLATAAAREQHEPNLSRVLADYSAAWSEPDSAQRAALLASSCVPGVRVRTTFACTNTLDELSAHIANGQKHMAGLVLGPDGAPLHLHGFVKSPWAVRGPDGRTVFSGVNFITLAPNGKIAGVVGFMG